VRATRTRLLRRNAPDRRRAFDLALPQFFLEPQAMERKGVIRFPYRGFGQSDLLKSAYEIG
jgi:hypothetical protein